MLAIFDFYFFNQRIKASASQDHDDEDDNPSDLARYHRLRRLCERKKSGKLLVPEEVHQDYRAGGAKRDALMAELESCDWKKDCMRQPMWMLQL